MEFAISQKIEGIIKKGKEDALMRCKLYGHDYQEVNGISGGKICICCGSRPEDNMKYEIGDILQDENGHTGIVCIDWNDGNDENLSYMENDVAHSSHGIIGHWPKDSIVEASERERRLQKLGNRKSCKTCLWDNKPRNEHCLLCLKKGEFIGWQQKLE